MSDSVIYQGEAFYRQSTGYYFQARTGQERLLHRRVWVDHRGPIPPGHEIHHIDGDWRNNSIENLELTTRGEHMRRHNLERWRQPAMAARMKEGLARAVQASKAWHASPEGIAWHQEHGKASWQGRERAAGAPCETCGGPIETFYPGRAQYCSTACQKKAAYKRDHNDERVCQCCGATFVANKHRKTRYCSRTCSNRSR